MKKQQGFTLVEMAIVVYFSVIVAIVIGLGWTACHFIAKFW